MAYLRRLSAPTHFERQGLEIVIQDYPSCEYDMIDARDERVGILIFLS